MKKFIAVSCIATILFASLAFAYKRDVSVKSESDQTQTEGSEQEPQQAPQEEYNYGSGGHGLFTAGYVCIAAGGAAAIAGTIIITGTDKRLTGVIVEGSGAALALAGTLMIVFGERSNYALAPTVNPAHNTYGLSFAANF